MKTWARIENGVVAETFDFETNPTPLFVPGWKWVEAPAGTVQGASYDGAEFANPATPSVDPVQPAEPQPDPELPTRRLALTPSEFRNSFSAFEEVAILDFVAGAETETNAQAKTFRKVVGVFFDRIKDPHLTTVDLADPRNLGGLDLLVSVGIITPTRRQEIASGLPA